MSEFQTHPVPANFKDAHINAEKYQAMYKRSIEDPEGFFGEMASEFLSWGPALGQRGQLRFREGRGCLVSQAASSMSATTVSWGPRDFASKYCKNRCRPRQLWFLEAHYLSIVGR
jgi:hypothetical protein